LARAPSLHIIAILTPILTEVSNAVPNYPIKQGVALTGRNLTGPPYSVGRPTAHAPGGRPGRPPAALQTTTTDDRRPRPLLVWPPTLCVGGPVIILSASMSVLLILGPKCTLVASHAAPW